MQEIIEKKLAEAQEILDDLKDKEAKILVRAEAASEKVAGAQAQVDLYQGLIDEALEEREKDAKKKSKGAAKKAPAKKAAAGKADTKSPEEKADTEKTGKNEFE